MNIVLVSVWFLFAFDTCICQETIITEDFVLSNDSRCYLPPQPDNGHWKLYQTPEDKVVPEPGDPITPNEIIGYECNTGYKLSGDKYVICSKRWGNFPKCRKLCSPLYSTATTIVECTDSKSRNVPCSQAIHGDRATYNCTTYHELPMGLRQSSWCVGGQWNHISKCQPVCGKKPKNETGVEHPWSAAIYRKKNDVISNVCMGTIISNNIVLTAAHCVTEESATLPAEDFIIGVGKLYESYQDPRDNQSSYHEVQKIIPHPKYVGEATRYHADIAIILMKKIFQWSDVVQPVCMTNIFDIPLREGQIGETASWCSGKGVESSDELQVHKMPFQNKQECTSKLPDVYGRYIVMDKLCVGSYGNDSNACQGGAGIVFRNAEDNRYYIHGISSLSPWTEGGQIIRFLYTKIAYHYEFIDQPLALYQQDECITPSYPENGKYVVEGDTDKKPGQLVTTLSVLKFSCNEGFVLSGSATVRCEDTAHDIPTCEGNFQTP